ncbi:IucA/IucC family siderophore biosynthesis protein, partial [Streptomyces sp. SID13726]|nr:IucA/IucC family siderophore biosynthesis protein [Streptomyces sp. SID13726]
MSLADAVAHLSPELWARANRALVRKGLAEFSHERLLTPTPLGSDLYSVLSDDSTVEYRFK